MVLSPRRVGVGLTRLRPCFSGGRAVSGPQAALGLDSSLLVCLLPSPLCLTVRPSVGPMARDVESLALCLRTLLSEDMYRLDPTVPRMPFREEVSQVGEQTWEFPCPLPSFLPDLSAISPSQVKTPLPTPGCSE